MKEKFDFDDINLIPKLCIVDSRSECDTSVTFGNHKFDLPIIPANMESVINEELAIKLAQNNYFYIMHRFGIDIVKFVEKMKNLNLISSISIGVNNTDYCPLSALLDLNLIPDYITIDIAHGHSLKVKKMLEYLKKYFKDTFVIAGNIMSEDAIKDLDEWGADAIKTGIGCGSVCSTYIATGFGSKNKQAYIIDKCSQLTKKPIIADGGIKCPGDITKSIVLGASMVMAGGILSCFLDSPGENIDMNDKLYKKYYGSASKYQNNKTNRIEGNIKYNEIKLTYLLDYMSYLKECLQSSISYAGGNKLGDLMNVDWF